MNHVNKTVGDINSLSETRSSYTTDPKFPDISSSNQPFISTIKEEVYIDPPTKSLKSVVAEGIIKCVPIAYVSVGIVHAIIYLISHLTCGNDTCHFLGGTSYVLFCALIIEILLGGTFKVILFKRPSNVKARKDKSWILFYITIVITGLVAAIDTMFELSEKIENLNITYICDNGVHRYCTETHDLVIPISHVFLLILSLLLMHNFMSKDISKVASIEFYFIYKATAYLLIMICIRWTIMEIVLISGRYYSTKIQHNDMFVCYNRSVIYSSLYQYTKVFAMAFPLVSAFATFSTIQRMPNLHTPILNEDKKPLLGMSTSTLPSIREFYFPDSFSTIIIIFFVFLAISLGSAIVDIYSTTGNNMMLVVSFSMLIPLYFISTILAACTLKICVDKYDYQSDKDFLKTESYVIWICLFGHFIHCIKFIWGATEHLVSENFSGSDLRKPYYIVSIVAFCMVLISAALQSILLDFIVKINMKRPINKSVITQLYFLCFPSISINIGYFVNAFIMITDKTTFKIPNGGTYQSITWYILTAISLPYSMLFNGVYIILMTRFLWRLRQHKVD